VGPRGGRAVLVGSVKQLIKKTRTGRGIGRSGFALIELVIAGSVLMIGALALVKTFAVAREVGRSNRETAIAAEVARGVLEQLESFEQHSALFALHNASPDDDPTGFVAVTGFTGSGFDVPALDAVEGDLDGLVGEVVFPVEPVTGALREDLVLPELGMPRDLNGDLVIDGADRSSDYILLPVLVRLRWESAGHVHSHEVRTILSPR
jgi:type II secretory pathway pseudopilin PulG